MTAVAEDAPRAEAERAPAREHFVLGDPLRAVAALGVFANHIVNVSQIHTGASLRESFGLIGGRVLGNLAIGLYVFFALSGYLIGRPFVAAWLAHEPGPQLKPYLARRLLRIVPAFWLFLTLAVVLLGARVSSAREAVAVYGFAQDFDPSELSEDFLQAWSMHSELVFYLLLPAVFGAAALVARRGRLAWLLGGLAVAWGASLVAIHADLDIGVWGRFPATLYAFVPGLLLAAIAPFARARLRAGPPPPRLVAALRLAIAGGVLLLVLYAAVPETHAAPRAAIVSIAVFALVGAALCREWAGMRPWRALDNRVLHWLGERSYGIYVVHFVVILQVCEHVDATAPAARLLIATAISVPIAIALAALSWRFVEHPILEQRRRFPLRASAP